MPGRRIYLSAPRPGPPAGGRENRPDPVRIGKFALFSELFEIQRRQIMRGVHVELIAGEINNGIARHNFRWSYGLLKQTFLLWEGREVMLCESARAMLSNLREAIQPETA